MRPRSPIRLLLLVLCQSSAICGICVQLRAAEPAEPADVTRANVMVVLDASGSMNDAMPGSRQSKMTVATEALVKVLQTVPAGTDVGVIVFGGRGKPGGRDEILPLGPLNPQKLADLAATLAQLRGNGGTPLDRYLKTGADALLAQRQTQLGYGTYRLLVVTDGEADKPKLVDAVVPDVLSRGVGIDVVGVAMNDRITLAERANSYRTAGDEAALRRAVGQVFAEVAAGRGDAAAAEGDFALLAGLPDGAAQQFLGALTRAKPGNVGDAPPPPPASGEPSPAGGALDPASGGGGIAGAVLLGCFGIPLAAVILIFVLIIVVRAKLRK